jgi:hypothetical protein
MPSFKKFAVVCSLGSMFALMATPPTRADDKKPVLDADAENAVRRSVYDTPPAVSPILPRNSRGEIASPPITIVVVPDPVPKLYKEHPRAVIELLLRIMDGANPRQSSQAAGYALELMAGPGNGLVCIEFFDPKTYDTVQKDSKTTLRQHWIKKVREVLEAKKRSS